MLQKTPRIVHTSYTTYFTESQFPNLHKIPQVTHLKISTYYDVT